jgi:hypothetical protein
LIEKRSAAQPATWGAAIDVPLADPYPYVPFGLRTVLVVLTPGAARSTDALCSEKEAMTSPLSVAPTLTTLAHAAGNSGTAIPSLPADATRSTPADQAWLIAVCSDAGQVAFGVVPPRLMLITFAP